MPINLCYIVHANNHSLCGISVRFQTLSPCIGQVTHALLTRPPLTSKEQAPYQFVRLACVKHAASVHPEPGSNSHKKVWALLSLLVRKSFLRNFVLILNLNGSLWIDWFIVTILFSKFIVSASLSLTSIILQYYFTYVNTFFYNFFIYLILLQRLCHLTSMYSCFLMNLKKLDFLMLHTIVPF